MGRAESIRATAKGGLRDEYDFSKAKRGAVVQSPGKTRITIMLDDDVIPHEQQAANHLTPRIPLSSTARQTSRHVPHLKQLNFVAAQAIRYEIVFVHNELACVLVCA